MLWSLPVAVLVDQELVDVSSFFNLYGLCADGSLECFQMCNMPMHLCVVPSFELACVSFVGGLQTVNHNAYHQDPYAQEFGIRISAHLAQVEARILPAPRVCLFPPHACVSDKCLLDLTCCN